MQAAPVGGILESLRIGLGFLWTVAWAIIVGFVIVFVPRWVWNALFLQGDGLVASAENAVMGVAVAAVSFVGSTGNVPFAVAL